ncbi:MAG: radical SAM protein [Clostridium sp.]|nr:radical SAM protein [Lachnoclostridium sp.]MCM1251265.1 radical SAM protein [Clostridium sp.]
MINEKKIAIFGAGNAGQYLCDELLKKEYKIVGFIDNFQKGEYRKIKIYRPQDFFDEFDMDTIYAVFLAAGAQKTLKLMIDVCQSHQCYNIYMMHDIVGKCRLPIFDENGLIAARVRKIQFSGDKPTLHYFEVPVTDTCNLNCKGCLFATNMPGDNQHIAFDSIQKDAQRMAELFFDVPWIRILGGEPLMHPDITRILGCYRELFPNSEIDLCTNGLLIPKMEESFWDCLKENHISIHVSGYKPTYNMLEQIDSVLKKHGLPYVILKRESFLKYYTDKPDNDMQQSFEKCIASSCYEVYRGKISSCSAAIAFEKFNGQFGTKYQIRENEDWFDIHRPDADAGKISEALGKASCLCKYCDTAKAESFEWDYARNGSGLQDYLIEKG